jgi:1,2-diacylglycerol 3-beta-galactosyltransferase
LDYTEVVTLNSGKPSERRNVLILTSDAGLGHRSAADAIAAALVKDHGDACAVEVVNPAADERAPGVLRSGEDDYDRIVQAMPDLYEFGYRISDAAVPASVIESALTVMLFGVMRDLLRRYRPHIIVSTYPMYQAPSLPSMRSCVSPWSS